MVSHSLDDILNLLRSGKLINTAFFRELDCVFALDDRDADAPFESEWLRLSDEIDDEFSHLNPSGAALKTVTEIMKTAFDQVLEATDDFDVAAYASDDFELFAKSVLIEYEDPFLDQIFATYADGKFPSPSFLVDLPDEETFTPESSESEDDSDLEER